VTHRNVTHGVLVGLLASVAALGGPALLTRPAGAQLGPGDPRRIYPGANVVTRPQPRPQPGFTGGVQFIPGYGYYYGGPYIIVNNAPCYVPYYYVGFGGGYGYGSYGAGGFSMGMDLGGLQMAYQQANGFGGFMQSTVPYGTSYGTGYPNAYNRAYDNADRASDAAAAAASAGQRTPPRRLQSDQGEPKDSSDDYYLNRKPSPLRSEPGLAQAVADIETAFRTGNSALLEKHLDPAEKLTIQSLGHTRRPLDVAQYAEMTRDALRVMKTVRYDLNHVEPGSNGAWMVYGTHVVRGESGGDQTFNVGFVLNKKQDKGSEKWIITEVSADPAR